MLTQDPNERITIKDALKHSWITKHNQNNDNLCSKENSKKNLRRISHMERQNTLQKACINNLVIKL